MTNTKMTAEERVQKYSWVETFGSNGTVLLARDAINIAEDHADTAVAEERQRIADCLPVMWYPKTELPERVLLLTQDWRRLRSRYLSAEAGIVTEHDELELSSIEEKAWSLYCTTTAGCMSARDFWHELSVEEKKYYLDKVKEKI